MVAWATSFELTAGRGNFPMFHFQQGHVCSQVDMGWYLGTGCHVFFDKRTVLQWLLDKRTVLEKRTAAR